MTLDEQIDEILKRAVRKARSEDSTAWHFNSDWHRDKIKALITDEVREAVKEEKSIRAKLITKAHKDGVADGLQMALYGVKNGSKEEKFIRHLLFSENIAELQQLNTDKEANQ